MRCRMRSLKSRTRERLTRKLYAGPGMHRKNSPCGTMRLVKSAPERDDAELVKLVLEGQTDLFAVLVDRYRTRLSRYVQRFTYDVEDARDVTQDVFIKVYGALDSFDPHFKFSTWLFRIAGNAAIDHLRRRRVRTLPLERPPGEDGERRPVDPPETRPNPHEE